ncbi:MAG: type II secretion system protein, partial [Desulfobulbaceae bacterium]|nr:type II secretion system protein [Desulfobulbaceae bacterium]
MKLSNSRQTANLTQQGFTLIEVIAVLLLMGIMVAIAVGRSGESSSQADLIGATETVKNHLRYAQSTAMNSDLSWGINFSGSTYTLRDANNVTATLP